jgi:methyl-accepting chemotaxis protein
MGALKDTISVVVTNVSAIRTGSGEISQAADDLSRRTEQQAASLEETAAALDEITATVNRTAAGARQAAETVRAAKSDAETSGNIVRDAVSAMGAIEQSAREINQIIGVIDEIAFQTNLLALNAGVEAARAGDAGRGFAVVASEVRALAQRSAEAAKAIKALITASTGQVTTGVSLVGQTGEALQRIVGRVAEIDDLMSEIAASAQEQASGLHQVNIAVNQMDQVTQQNAAMVEESTAASHSLTQEAASLAGSVSRFQISPAAQLVRSASRSQNRPTSQTVTAMRTSGRGGAARRLEPVASEDSWEEF